MFRTEIVEERATVGRLVVTSRTPNSFTFVGSELRGPWELIATHRAGSLNAAVAQLRTRNLGISFSILVLLGGSMALILISARREQRLARQQMEFVSAVSHELRTPLAVICSAGENLADGVVSDHAQAREYGAVVRNQGRRLTEMVEQVLDFAGMQSGRRSYNLRPTDVEEAIEHALEPFEMQIRSGGIAMERRIQVGTPLVLADRSALIRVIQNLISNALKYGQPGNWIGIHVTSTTGTVSIAVQDRGAGISPVDLPHIFEPFYRGRAVIDAQVKGSGLGLSIVKQIVEAHGGRITVDCASGTTFMIVLPRSAHGESIPDTKVHEISSEIV
jgi:signal transduction histidine kinase